MALGAGASCDGVAVKSAVDGSCEDVLLRRPLRRFVHSGDAPMRRFEALRCSVRSSNSFSAVAILNPLTLSPRSSFAFRCATSVRSSPVRPVDALARGPCSAHSSAPS